MEALGKRCEHLLFYMQYKFLPQRFEGVLGIENEENTLPSSLK